MTDYNIKIKNCNNIKDGDLTIKENYLNIKYGMNGIGKSTLSNAILLSSQGKQLDELKPFGSDDTSVPDIKIDKKFSHVEVFNEAFVNDIVFKESTVIANAFDVFVRTPEYERCREDLNNKLSILKSALSNNKEILDFQENIDSFNKNYFELSKNGKYLNQTKYLKAILKKNNIYSVPKELQIFSDFFSDKSICIDWIDWKSKGQKYNTKGICPFCGQNLENTFSDQSRAFNSNYKKLEVKNLNEVLENFEKLHPYINEDYFQKVVECIKENKSDADIKLILGKFYVEYKYIQKKLSDLHQFGNIVQDIDVTKIDEELKKLRFDNAIFEYFSTSLLQRILLHINDLIDEIILISNDLKKSISILKNNLQKTIKQAKDEINDFLKTSGIPYELKLDLSENDNDDAIASLVYVKDKNIDVFNIKSHLSWGERNAFALILFMYYSLSQNADLIVLDDPVSSFDINKKYAIIHKLFPKKMNNSEKSFANKTVLMLTHDFEPVIDLYSIRGVNINYVDAKYLKNHNGILNESIIQKESVKPVTEILTEIVLDDSVQIVCRVAILRKLYEHLGKDRNKDAYDVLSNLEHGRNECQYYDGKKMEKESIEYGFSKIEKYIKDFDYSYLHDNFFNVAKIVNLYHTEINNYYKILYFREILELDNTIKAKLDNVLIKFINESFHIENDYSYYLDFRKYDIVPDHIIKSVNEFMDTYKTTI